MDRYFNNGTGIPMSEDEYYDYTYENDLPEEYELSQEEKDYLVGKTFDLFYYASSDDEETNVCTFWLDEDDKIYFDSGLFSVPLGEDYSDRISDKVDPEGKEPFELFCLNFMYNVLCKYGYQLGGDFTAAAYDCCIAYQYIVRDDNGDVFEGEIDWSLREIID